MAVYFIGIGGIGMSAIARHFNALGVNVAGYDRTRTRLTDEVAAEGIDISFRDDEQTIPAEMRRPDDTLVVVTPAIPADNAILNYFRKGGFRIVKRAEALGELTRAHKTLCVAGTHGKTTTSTLVAHILKQSAVGCSAFLGGISVNHQTNFWSNTSSDFVVTEADEFDRSFLHLTPHAAAITAMDADHLDIYGSHAEVIKAFRQFAHLIVPGGLLVHKYGLDLSQADVQNDVLVRTYSLDNPEADYHAENIRVENGRYVFDACTPAGLIAGVRLGLPGRHNIENCIAAIALAMFAGASSDDVILACESFRGNRRRFELALETPNAVVIDDYAHHPEEIRATLSSVRELYAGRRLTVAFQPHLYTRTRDLADDFASALSLADRTWLLDIYPARELPIPGVTSRMLLDKMKPGVGRLSSKDALAADIISEPTDVVVVMGAGDIDRLVAPIADAMRSAHDIH